MKQFVSYFLIAMIGLLLAACSAPDAAPGTIVSSEPAAVMKDSTPTPYAGAYLSTEYTDAANLRNQLAFGTLQLQSTTQAVTFQQAQVLIPLWQAIVALSGDETTASEELTAVQNQIAEAMTPAQLEAIAKMQITNANLNAFYAENGIVFPTPVPGATKVSGKNSGLSQADREATKTAAQALGTPVGTGSSTGQAARTLLFEKTIEYLLNVQE